MESLFSKVIVWIFGVIIALLMFGFVYGFIYLFIDFKTGAAIVGSIVLAFGALLVGSRFIEWN